MRLAGTARQYSIKAMPQLTTIAIKSGVERNLRCPYQAKVMNRLEPISIRIGAIWGEVSAGMTLCRRGARGRLEALRFCLVGDDAETVAKRIGAEGDRRAAADFMFLFDDRAGADGPGKHGVEILDVKIDMDRGPMALIAANIFAAGRRLGAGG